jgi:hypothetical protein
MRLDGYKLLKINGQWRAFLVKPPKWRKMK